MKPTTFLSLLLSLLLWAACVRADDPPDEIRGFFAPPPAYAGDLGRYRSPMVFDDGSLVKTAADWQRRRKELLDFWHGALGPWPKLLETPRVKYLKSERRESFMQHRLRLEVAPDQYSECYLLIPEKAGRHPAVVVPFYDPETSVGLKDSQFRAFALDLTRRGFVTLSIGSPGGDARKPEKGSAVCQPLSFLAYIVANCHSALSKLPQVDPQRIGIVGHSYGGKWAMFASCLHERFAAAAWSDPGIVFDESRPNVNYWEPWYIGLEPRATRKPGVPKAENPRMGPYKKLFESGHDLHELHVLMCPRPFLVSGGSEDPPERWRALNHSIAVNALLGQANRVAMTNRPGHSPTEESNRQMYAFLEHFLKP
jgi:hypothetical protein